LADRPRHEYVVASKVGRLLRPVRPRPATIFRDIPDVDPVFDFSRDGVLRSIEESLMRLGLDRLDVVHVHDPDDHEADALATAFPTLIELREQGVIGRVGCGMNQAEMLSRFVVQVDLDCVLLAGRYSLLDRRGAGLLDQCAAHGVEVIIGGVFNSGLLARPEVGATFDYAAAPAALVEQARAMQVVCAEHGVALPAAAMQFAMRHPAVRTVLVGARSAEEIVADVSYDAAVLPDELWQALDSVTL
jgi:D-threo-aldose 1-dehydrogenase